MLSNSLGTSPMSREPFQALEQKSQNRKFKHGKLNLKAHVGLIVRGENRGGGTS